MKLMYTSLLLVMLSIVITLGAVWYWAVFGLGEKVGIAIATTVFTFGFLGISFVIAGTE